MINIENNIICLPYLKDQGDLVISKNPHAKEKFRKQDDFFLC